MEKAIERKRVFSCPFARHGCKRGVGNLERAKEHLRKCGFRPFYNFLGNRLTLKKNFAAEIKFEFNYNWMKRNFGKRSNAGALAAAVAVAVFAGFVGFALFLAVQAPPKAVA